VNASRRFVDSTVRLPSPGAVCDRGRLLFYDLRARARDLHARLTAAQVDALRRTILASRAPPPGALT